MPHFCMFLNHEQWIEDYWSDSKEAAVKELFGDEDGNVNMTETDYGSGYILHDYNDAVLHPYLIVGANLDSPK